MRHAIRVTAVLCAVGAALVAAAPAGASTSHVLTGAFGSATSTVVDPYPLARPTDVEIDQATLDIYVADAGNHRIEKFTPSGEFLLMFGREVNKTAVETAGRSAEEDVCPAPGHPGDVCQDGVSAETPGALESPEYLAVDNNCALHEPPLTAATAPTCEAFDPSSGDVYVADPGDALVSKFLASGELDKAWGTEGQKNGADASLPNFPALYGIAVGGPEGHLFVGTAHPEFGSINALEYTQDGTSIPGYYNPPGAYFLKVGPSGAFYAGEPYALDRPANELYENTGSVIEHFPTLEPTEAADSFGSGDLFGAMGISVNHQSQAVYVANSSSNEIAVFGSARPIVTTGPFTEASESEVTLTGEIDPAGRGNITACHFEYGFDKSYGKTVPCTPDPTAHPFEGPTKVTARIGGFSAGTRDHYRLVATNTVGATAPGLDETFITTQAPAIDGLASANLTATGADLNAQVNPNGLETSYEFVYGQTIGYGQSAPVPAGTLAAGNADQRVSVHLEGLEPHVVYHYALLATNADGTTTTEDHTFNFYPPGCPNENVRQQTQANYLPDCRAYELVSPGDAGGTLLFPGGPNTGQAASPSRFSFTGLYSTIPGSGGSPIDGIGDLYVATRTDTGWTTKYVGLPSGKVAVDGGPPMGPPASGMIVGVNHGNGSSNESNGNTYETARIQNEVLTNPSMSDFVDWNDGELEPAGASNAPYVWNAEGGFVDRWPTNLAALPGGSLQGPSGRIATGSGVDAMDCPSVSNGTNLCPGDVTASSDLSHFVFATEWSPAAPDGLTSPPGSVYDNDVTTDTVTVASKTPEGADIPSEPGDHAGDPLQIPAVSASGSHILMAAGDTGPCGAATCELPAFCGSFSDSPVRRCPMQPSHLYMRVDDTVTYDVSQGHAVSYVGMTPDGSKVYFLSAEQLTGEDHDSSVDLYMWSEEGEAQGHPLTLVSKGDNAGNAGEPGNTDSCEVGYVEACGVVPYSSAAYCMLPGGAGGNCRSDNSIAADNGDIYFFSPEQLDGSRGLPNQENLYVFRNGRVQFATTLVPGDGPFCTTHGGFTACSDTPIARMEVNPNDTHMAFVTSSPVTQYDNAGHLEMYTFAPSTGQIVCVSCNPSGEPPTSNVEASQDGLFMADDGRTFFSTEEALVHGDTNDGEDVYEYVDGRPQLITPGTGDAGAGNNEGEDTVESFPGLIGVSANGTDVYFSTRDTLVPQDHNGIFIKFYDARASGGFSASPPPPGCDAADECHGPGNSAAPTPPIVSEIPLSRSGNVTSAGGTQKHGKKQAHKRHRHKHRHSHRASRGGGR